MKRTLYLGVISTCTFSICAIGPSEGAKIETPASRSLNDYISKAEELKEAQQKDAELSRAVEDANKALASRDYVEYVKNGYKDPVTGQEKTFAREQDVIDYFTETQGKALAERSQLQQQLKQLLQAVEASAKVYIKNASMIEPASIVQITDFVRMLPNAERVAPKDISTFVDSLANAIPALEKEAVNAQLRLNDAIAQSNEAEIAQRKELVKQAEELAQKARSSFVDFVAKQRQAQLRSGSPEKPRTSLIEKARDFFTQIATIVKERLGTPSARLEIAWSRVETAPKSLASFNLSSVSFVFLMSEFNRLKASKSLNPSEAAKLSVLESYVKGIEASRALIGEPLGQQFVEAISKNSQKNGKTDTDALLRAALDDYAQGSPNGLRAFLIDCLPSSLFKGLADGDVRSPYDALGIGAEWRLLSRNDIQTRYAELKDPTPEQKKALDLLMKNKAVVDARMELAEGLLTDAFFNRLSKAYIRSILPPLEKALTAEQKNQLRAYFDKEKSNLISTVDAGYVQLFGKEGLKGLMDLSYKLLAEKTTKAVLALDDATAKTFEFNFNQPRFKLFNAFTDQINLAIRPAIKRMLTDKTLYASPDQFEFLTQQVKSNGSFDGKLLRNFSAPLADVFMNEIFKAFTGFDMLEFALGFEYGEVDSPKWSTVTRKQITERYNMLSADSKNSLKASYQFFQENPAVYLELVNNCVIMSFETLLVRSSVNGYAVFLNS